MSHGLRFAMSTFRILLLFVLGCAGALTFVRADAPPLFAPAPPPKAAAARTPATTSSGATSYWQRYPGTPTARPEAWRPGDRWALPDPAARAATSATVCVVKEVRRDASGSVLVRGAVENEPGSEVRLSFAGDAVAGTWRRGDGERAHLEPSTNGRLRLRLQAPGSPDGPRCGNSADAGEDGRALAQALARAPGVQVPAPGTNVLDVVFVFTPAAEAGAGGRSGMDALLSLAIDEANASFAQSGVGLSVRAAYRSRIEYVESGDLSRDLDRLGKSGDGALDEVHGWRDVYAGDVVCLITESEDTNLYAGMAQQLRSTDAAALARGFLVCLRPYLVGNYTLPHELGHTLGCNHDRDNAGGSGLHSWSYGNRFTVEGQQYRTIMAYRPGIQVPYFSSPEVFFRGVPTGIASGTGAADNVRTLNLTRAWVAGVREPECRIGWSASVLEVREHAGRVRLELQRRGTPFSTIVRARTVAGSALPDRDYRSLDTFVTWPAGQETASVELELLATESADPIRRFDVLLSEPTGGVALGPYEVLSVVLFDADSRAAAPLDSQVRCRSGADYLVTALLPEEAPADGWYVAGGFATFANQAHPRLVRLRPDGSPDPTFQPRVKYRVNALARRSDGRLVIGGEFNTVNDERRNHVAVLRSDGSLDPDFRFDTGTSHAVHALLALPEGRVLLGGSFTNVQGVPAQRLARVLPNGDADASFETRAGPNGPVYALVLAGESSGYYVGGAFDRVGETRRVGVARVGLNGGLDAGFGSAEVAGPEGMVFALAVEATGGVLVGGDFARYHGREVGGLVRLTSAGELDEAFLQRLSGGVEGSVRAILPTAGGRFWIGGTFHRVAGQVRHHLARLESDGRLDPTFDPADGPDDGVLALAATPRGVLIGGLFAFANGVPREGVAAYLGEPLAAPRFELWTRQAPGMAYEARGVRGQSYQLEGTDDLSSWGAEPGEILRVDPESDHVSGVLPLGEPPRRFWRLQRHLE